MNQSTVYETLFAMITAENIPRAEREEVHQWMADPKHMLDFAFVPQRNALWLRKVLTCGKPITPVFLEFSDVVTAILPELAPCVGFDHCSIYHKHNVYEHCLAVTDGCHTDDFCVKLAALLHDIGKPHVYTTDKAGHRHFHGHAESSVAHARQQLQYLELPEAEIALILELIAHHDMQLSSSEKALQRAILQHGDWDFARGVDFIRKWAILRQSDRDDHNYPTGTATRFYTDIDGILKTLDVLEAREAAFKVSDLVINGTDLMDTFGLPECPLIGWILKALCEQVRAGEIQNVRHELLNASLFSIISFASALSADMEMTEIDR